MGAGEGHSGGRVQSTRLKRRGTVCSDEAVVECVRRREPFNPGEGPFSNILAFPWD